MNLGITPRSKIYGAAFVEGLGGVVVTPWLELGRLKLGLWHCSGRIGKWKHRAECDAAIERAAAKIGWYKNRAGRYVERKCWDKSDIIEAQQRELEDQKLYGAKDNGK